jgi:hypothetical protein
VSWQFRCKKCGSFRGYSSRSRGFFEKYLMPFLLLRPARCRSCFRRSWVPRFVDLHEPEPTQADGASA